MPKVSKISDMNAEYHRTFDDVSQLLHFQSRLLAEEGKPEGALAYATMLVELSSKLGRSDAPTLIYSLGDDGEDGGGMTREKLKDAMRKYGSRGIWDKDVWLEPDPSFPIDTDRQMDARN